MALIVAWRRRRTRRAAWSRDWRCPSGRCRRRSKDSSRADNRREECLIEACQGELMAGSKEMFIVGLMRRVLPVVTEVSRRCDRRCRRPVSGPAKRLLSCIKSISSYIRKRRFRIQTTRSQRRCIPRQAVLTKTVTFAAGTRTIYARCEQNRCIAIATSFVVRLS